MWNAVFYYFYNLFRDSLIISSRLADGFSFSTADTALLQKSIHVFPHMAHLPDFSSILQ